MDALEFAFKARDAFKEQLYKALGVHAYDVSDIINYMRRTLSDENWYGEGKLPLFDALDMGYDYCVMMHLPLTPEGGKFWRHTWYLTFWDANDHPWHYMFVLDYNWMQTALKHCRLKGGKELDANDWRVFLELD